MSCVAASADGGWDPNDRLIILARRRNNYRDNLLRCVGPRTEARAVKAPVGATFLRGCQPVPPRFFLALQTRTPLEEHPHGCCNPPHRENSVLQGLASRAAHQWQLRAGRAWQDLRHAQ